MAIRKRSLRQLRTRVESFPLLDENRPLKQASGRLQKTPRGPEGLPAAEAPRRDIARQRTLETNSSNRCNTSGVLLLLSHDSFYRNPCSRQRVVPFDLPSSHAKAAAWCGAHVGSPQRQQKAAGEPALGGQGQGRAVDKHSSSAITTGQSLSA